MFESKAGFHSHIIPPTWRLILLLALVAGKSRAEEGDWFQWRGPRRDGVSSETGWSVKWPKEGPRRLWAAKIGIGYSSVSVSGGRMFTMGNDREVDYVYCIDSATGALLWRYGYPCPSADPMGYRGPRCTPTVDEGRVYTLSRGGDLVCLSLDNGKLIWKHQLLQEYGALPPQWGFSCSPLIESGMLIVESGAVGQSVIAFNKETGKLIWATGRDLAAYSSPVAYDFGGQRCVADFSAALLTARNALNGRILWTYPWKTSYDVNAATPIVFGDKAFISSGYGSGCALIQFDESGPPQTLWSNKNMRNHFSSCVLWEGHLYGFDESELRCLDLFNGSVNWSTPAMGKGSLMLADGKLIVFGESGRLSIAPAVPTGYRELAATQATGGRSTWAPPVLCHARIYCRANGTVVCLDVGQPIPAKK